MSLIQKLKKRAAESRPVRVAVNQVMGHDDTPLTGDCEVAFFPPVTGG